MNGAFENMFKIMFTNYEESIHRSISLTSCFILHGEGQQLSY